jgi:prevent-host-death family protein
MSLRFAAEETCYTFTMTVSIAEAKSQFLRLVKAVEEGETVIITRQGRPIAQLGSPPVSTADVILGGMKGRVKLLPGWDAPVELDRFLSGEV